MAQVRRAGNLIARYTAIHLCATRSDADKAAG
jgi:hypothetical protein